MMMLIAGVVLGLGAGVLITSLCAAAARTDAEAEWRERCRVLTEALREETRYRDMAERQITALEERLDRERAIAAEEA